MAGLENMFTHPTDIVIEIYQLKIFIRLLERLKNQSDTRKMVLMEWKKLKEEIYFIDGSWRDLYILNLDPSLIPSLPKGRLGIGND